MFFHLKLRSAAGCLLLAVMLAACNTPKAPATNAATVLTQAAGTAAARLTESALTMPTPTATSTPAPSSTPALPDASPTPPQAANTATPASTATQPQAAVQDAAAFVADIDYPDNTIVNPGETFTKTWQIKNIGATTWNTSYSLVCIDAGRFTCPQPVSLPLEVKSGENVTLKITLTAPTSAGTHKAFFRLRNAAGQFFKVDGGDLWVQIVVGSGGATATPASPTPGSTSETPSATPEPQETATPTPES